MTDTVKSWIRENYFLGGLFVGLFSVIAYAVRLEARVSILEDRGSPHLAEINNRLTVTEKETEANKVSLRRIIDTMTKDLHISPSRIPPP
jgi:hypothetical protein